MIHKFKGFSLVEALLSLVIITLIFVLSIPFLTKKALSFNEKLGRQSEGFYYEHPSDLNEINEKCYITYVSESNDTVINDTGNCQKYEFIIPNKVHKIDLTLVAGGGGGGGASGGVEYSESIQTSTNKSKNNNKMDYIKKIIIDTLIGSGTSGPAPDSTSPVIVSESTSIQAGQGGNSGYAILNFDMPRDFLIKIGALKKHQWYINSNESFNLEIASINAAETGEDETLPAGYTGGLSLRFGKDDSDAYKYKIVVPNGNVGNDSGNFCVEPDAHNDIGNVGVKMCYLKNKDDTKCEFYENINDIKNGNYCSDDFCQIISSYLPNYSLRCKQGAMGSVISGITDNFYNAVYKGGTGGFVPGYYGTYGSGSIGYSILCNGSSCIKKAHNLSPGGQFGKVTTTYQYPGHIGKGGLGGAAVILNDFPVVPGSKYTIYVGKGGTGGGAGSYGKYENGNSSETSGGNGLGGSSTAIFDEDDNLVLMVIGGGGGFGGRAIQNTPSNNIARDDYSFTLDSSAPMQRPILVFGNTYINKILTALNKNHHGNVVSFPNETWSEVSHALGGRTFGHSNGLWRIAYRYKDVGNNKEDRAYISKPAVELLNTNNDGIYGTGSINLTNFNASEKRISSFANYTNNIDSTFAQRNGNSSYMDYNLQNDAGYYGGFYYRYLMDDDFMFSGGLGGFSGISSKSGCGGGFIGIEQSYRMNPIVALGGTGGSYDIKKLLNNVFSRTFFVNENNTYNANNIYRVDEYFDNCTINTPNGQSAKFIAPVISTVEGEAVGQAGAGGGGGGWSTKNGAGKGGDGQNGYVFITWRKR